MFKTLRYLRFALLSALFVSLVGLNSCYYDNEEDLYKNIQTAQCDTTNVTYAGTIAPIMQQYCYSCHSTTAANGGVIVDTYAGLAAICTNGLTSRLYGDINFLSGYDNMPKGGTKLTDCEILKIRAWLLRGYPNN